MRVAEMTDRELLELAAKAAGYQIVDPYGAGEFYFKGGGKWNSLTDDGDALRLAVKLGMDLGIYLPTDKEDGTSYTNTKHLLGYGAEGYASYQDHKFMQEKHDNDPYAATRRAVVRAAAEIGKEMK